MHITASSVIYRCCKLIGQAEQHVICIKHYGLIHEIKIYPGSSVSLGLGSTIAMSSPPFKSEVSEKIAVRFYNFSTVQADVLWVNYQGTYEKYCTLRPKQFIDVNTFFRHYWIFVEKNTTRSLMANDRPYFLAEEQKYPNHTRARSTRYCVVITGALVPTLKILVINYLSNYVKSCTDVKHLEIPKTLKKEIIVKIHGIKTSSHSDNKDTILCERNLDPVVAQVRVPESS